MKPSPVDFVLASLARAHAHTQYGKLMRAAQQARKTQDRVLLRHVHRARGSDFARDHDFKGVRNYADFVDRVPVQTYEAIRPYVTRVMKGDSAALFCPGRRILMFAKTSGTTDQPKYVPVTAEFLGDYRRGWQVFGFKALLDHPAAFLRPILRVVSPLDDERTAHGIPCGAISGLLAATQKEIVRRYYATPNQVAYIRDPEARYYTIMRLAIPRDVSWMVTASPATQLKLATTAAQHAERIIRDIHDGTLNPPGDLRDKTPTKLQTHLYADPATAKRLDGILRRRGELLPRDYWNLAYLANWTGGTMGLHLHEFPEYFGDTPVRDIGLLATEGRITIPLDDATPAGVLDIAGSFFEFVESDGSTDDRHTIRRCHELEVGKEYRVIITNSAGFFRYDIGDYVRVRGYLGEAPLLEFLHRGEHVSSITGEKITEWQVVTALARAADAVGCLGQEFILAPAWADPPFYRLHIECDELEVLAARPRPDFQMLVRRLDDELRTLNVEYASKRASGRLAAIVFNPLPAGTLAQLDPGRRKHGETTNEQFKRKVLYTKPGEDQELLALHTDFSSALPAALIAT